MAGPRRKKYESGEGAQYWTRARALNKLQLTLKDFRRLCILKGIYPREPRNRKRAQQGSTGIKTLYNKKDIQFLMHEPIIWRFRELKVHGRKIGRAKAMHEHGLAKNLMYKPIHIKLDHIVKERYPTFMDALRDLDDCLTLCHLFSSFPSLKHIPRDQSVLCRRLMLEFMQAMITSKALRKVFISIKGFYFQVDIKGQLVTWIMPHQFSFEPQTKEEVDFKIMSTFVQFYIVLLGFINFRLYHTLNLYYPPRIRPIKGDNSSEDLVDRAALSSERIASLNFPLVEAHKLTEEEVVEVDTFDMPTTDEGDKLEKARVEAEKVEKLKTLFEGMKVFLNREVPREPLVFILRSFGAQVSWDKTLFVGSTFDESDETITHQIVDRPTVDKQYISRYYVQPQWVFDSVNARALLPVEKYFIGVTLPPHLSPFVDETREQIYHPPEERDLFGKDKEEVDEEPLVEQDEDDSEDEAETENDDDDDDDDDETKQKAKALKEKMSVTPGKVAVEDPADVRKKNYEEYKLREKMVEKKHRALYKSMMKGRALRTRDAKLLKRKRETLERKKVSSR